MTTKCPKCEGCGQVANTEEQEPWNCWVDVMGVIVGAVRPITCPRCLGLGQLPSQNSDHKELYALVMDEITQASRTLVKYSYLMQQLVEGKQYMDSVGNLLDPTLYRNMLSSKSFATQLDLAEIVVRYSREYTAIQDAAFVDNISEAEKVLKEKCGGMAELEDASDLKSGRMSLDLSRALADLRRPT